MINNACPYLECLDGNINSTARHKDVMHETHLQISQIFQHILLPNIFRLFLPLLTSESHTWESPIPHFKKEEDKSVNYQTLILKPNKLEVYWQWDQLCRKNIMSNIL